MALAERSRRYMLDVRIGRNRTVVFVAIVLLAMACGAPPELQHEGGGWYTGHAGSTHTGLARIDLYRTDSAGPRTRIDEDVLILHFYPPDCIVYEPGRDAGVIYAACGELTPVQIAFHPPWQASSGYEATADALRSTGDVRVAEGRAVATMAHVALDDILRVAMAAPPRAPDWQLSTGETRAALEPAITEVVVDPQSRDSRDATPLMHAAREGQVAVVDALLRAGADVDARDSYGTAALISAIMAMRPDTTLIRRLLQAGADTEVTDPLGATALMLAAITRESTVFTMLLEHGADPCARDTQGRSIVDVAGDHVRLRPLAADAYRQCAG